MRRPLESWPTPRPSAVSGPGLPSHRVHPRSHRTWLVRVGLGMATVAVLAWGVGMAFGPTPLPTPVHAPLVLRPAVTGTPAVRATDVDIPALGVHSVLVPLGVDAVGALVPPASPSVAGWFTGGAAPGDPGPTVIAGHVDSRTGPGVFYRLKDLVPGDEVTVGRSDGTVARYRVTVTTAVAKKAFPTDTVYGPTPGPELRLITCGGEFDRSIGHYLRNVVVSAVLVG